MADISRIPGRTLSQARVTTNRDTILPARRQTELDALSVRSDMRTASRGDGGAGDLQRTLSGFLDSAQGAFNANTAANKPKYAAEAAAGQMAAATGAEPTPEQARSQSFMGALYGARAVSQHNAFAAEQEQKVNAAVEAGADDAEIHDLIMEGMTVHRDTFLENNPDPAALAAEGARMVALGNRLSTGAVTRIRAIAREELITTQGGNLDFELDNWPPEALPAPEQPLGTAATEFVPTDGPAGDPTVEGPGIDVYANAAPPPLPVERWVAERIAGGFTGAEAKAQVIQSVVNAATNRDNPRPELIEQMLESKQADGRTPSFNPAEVSALQERLSQARNLADGVEKERHDDARDDATAALFTRALAGEDVTAEVIALGQQGIYDPQETSGAIGLLRGLSTVREEGRVNASYVAEVQRRIASGNPMSNAAILQAEAEGRFGTGLAAKRAATQALITPASLRGGGGGAEARGRQLMPSGMTRTEERSYAWDQVQDAMFQSTPDQPLNGYETRANALIGSYFNSLQDGRVGRMNPQEALNATLVEMRRRAENHTRLTAPPRTIPPGRAAVAPGTYRWGANGVAQ